MANLRSSAAYRIAFTYSAAFALAILLLGGTVYLAADAEFRRQRDQAITEEAAQLAIEGDGPKLAREIAEREAVRSTNAFGYALFDPSGRRVAGSLVTSRPQPGFGSIVFQDPREGPDAARARTVALADGYRLTVAIDSEPIEAIDKTILTLFGGAFVVVLAVGAGGALLLGSYLRHRLATISATASAVGPEGLRARVVVGPRGDEFDQVALAINAMLDRIAQLMDNLRQVSSDVAHDLRTPLVRLRNQLTLVGTVEGAADRAIAQSDALLDLFAAILRIAEVEGAARPETRAPVDLSALATDVAETYQPAIEDSGRTLHWSVEAGVAVPGDRELLAQALVNLLDNARVHTPAGTRVLVGLTAGDGRARLSVADDGPGVPQDDRARILQRFARGEASRTTPGNGLGLSLVAAVAASHGGEVLVEDATPGLRMTMALPRSAA